MNMFFVTIAKCLFGIGVGACTVILNGAALNNSVKAYNNAKASQEAEKDEEE